MTEPDEHVSPQTLQPLGAEWVSRPRYDERVTREPLRWWDRIKFVVLLFVVYFFFVLREINDNPIISTREAMRLMAETKWVIWVLLALELLRQLHIYTSEHWGRYHQFWRDKIWTKSNDRIERFDPWVRYRVSRVAKLTSLYILLSCIFAVRWDTTPWDAAIKLPGRTVDTLFSSGDNAPLIFAILFPMVFLVG